MAERFSLLLTVYAGDRTDYVRDAFRSAVDAQTRRPEQVVLVQDGPVPAELDACLDEVPADSPVEVTFLRMERNGGLGVALDQGLEASRHDVVARMDADDIAMPQRFAVQLPVIEDGADLVGAGMLEFGGGPGRHRGAPVRRLRPGDIARYARLHDPFNHPTVVYRRAPSGGGRLRRPAADGGLLAVRPDDRDRRHGR